MKKIISSVFSFMFVFNFVSNVFSSQVCDIDLNTFDSFSIEQVQKTFSNTLSQEQKTKTDTQNTASDCLTLNDLDYNLNNILIKKINLLPNLFFELGNVYSLNYLYKYKLFENNCSLNNCGITQYEIKINSYIAVVLFDINNVLNYCR